MSFVLLNRQNGTFSPGAYCALLALQIFLSNRRTFKEVVTHLLKTKGHNVEMKKNKNSKLKLHSTKLGKKRNREKILSAPTVEKVHQ